MLLEANLIHQLIWCKLFCTIHFLGFIYNSLPRLEKDILLVLLILGWPLQSLMIILPFCSFGSNKLCWAGVCIARSIQQRNLLLIKLRDHGWFSQLRTFKKCLLPLLTFSSLRKFSSNAYQIIVSHSIWYKMNILGTFEILIFIAINWLCVMESKTIIRFSLSAERFENIILTLRRSCPHIHLLILNFILLWPGRSLNSSP